MTTGDMIFVCFMVGIPAVGLACAIYSGLYGGMPFTARGRMGVAYARERDRRAADLVKLGVDPDDAIKRAAKDMAKEAEEVLKEDK